ncbi:MAG: 30S ribosomal protein S20 [Methylococcaceae bacterium]|nr:30S ribosomal protein S20 [Prolixibacteraceae bacterium]
MAHHKSTKKRIKQDEVKSVQNKYYAKTMRNAVKKLRLETDKEAAAVSLPKVVSMIDKLAKKNIIHPNKASNLKSSLALHLNAING